MLPINILAHSSNDQRLLFAFVLSLTAECVCVEKLLKRAPVFVRVCECVLFAVAALICVRDDDDDDVVALMLSENDVCSGGGAGACTYRAVLDCVR